MIFNFLCFSSSALLLYLAEAALPEQLVQDEVIDGELGMVILLGNGVQRLLDRQRLGDRPVSRPVP